MKWIKYIPLVVLLAIPTMGIAELYVEGELVSQTPSLLGPYEPYSEEVSASFTYKVTSDMFYETLTFYDISGASTYYSASSYNRTFSSAKKTLTFSLKFPFDLYLGNSGLKISIKFFNRTTNKLLKTISKNLYPKLEETIISSKYQTSPYEINNRILDFTNQRTTIETYCFDKTIHKIVNDSFSKMNLSNVSFYYTFESSFTYQKMYLSFKDPDNYFPYIYGQKSYKTIPLKLRLRKKTTDYFTFAFDNGLYVNTKTLEMSNLSMSGFVATNYFYIAPDLYKRLENFSFTIQIEGAGVNNTNISFPLTFVQEVFLFDNCFTGDFCVIGGLKS